MSAHLAVVDTAPHWSVPLAAIALAALFFAARKWRNTARELDKVLAVDEAIATRTITRSGYHNACLTGRHGPESLAEAQRIDAVLAELEKEWHGEAR